MSEIHESRISQVTLRIQTLCDFDNDVDIRTFRDYTFVNIMSVLRATMLSLERWSPIGYITFEEVRATYNELNTFHTDYIRSLDDFADDTAERMKSDGNITSKVEQMTTCLEHALYDINNGKTLVGG
jgi:hypothetical protein